MLGMSSASTRKQTRAACLQVSNPRSMVQETRALPVCYCPMWFVTHTQNPPYLGQG